MTPRATESDILAWVEGETLSAERADAVQSSFANDPDLRRWAEGMRRDRESLTNWGAHASASAPRGLGQAAIESVERDALLGVAPVELERARQEAAAREARPTVLFRMRWVAVAAAVLIVGGVSIVALVQQGGSGSGGVMNHQLAEATPAPVIDEQGVAARGGESLGQAFADAVDRESDLDAAANDIASGALASAESTRRERRANANEIADLARQRRLMVRAQARDRDAVLARAIELGAAQQEAIAFNTGEAGVEGEDGAEAGAIVEARANALLRLVGLLEEAGAYDVQLVAVEGVAPPSNPADVFWWTEPVDRWATLVRVPIVISGETPGETVIR